MKAHLTERNVKGLQPKQTSIIVYDEEVVVPRCWSRMMPGSTRADLPPAIAARLVRPA